MPYKSVQELLDDLKGIPKSAEEAAPAKPAANAEAPKAEQKPEPPKGEAKSEGKAEAAPVVDINEMLKRPEFVTAIMGILGGGALGYGLTAESKNTLRNVLLGMLGGGLLGYGSPWIAEQIGNLFQKKPAAPAGQEEANKPAAPAAKAEAGKPAAPAAPAAKAEAEQPAAPAKKPEAPAEKEKPAEPSQKREEIKLSPEAIII